MDLKGQLSNPRETLETLAGQGSRRRADRADNSPHRADLGDRADSRSSASEGKGRLSNPAKRRLTDTRIDDLVARHEAGSTIEMLARTFGIHRTTLMAHFERRCISRRSLRNLTEEMVTGAAHRYASGEALAEIARTSASPRPHSPENSSSPVSPSGNAADRLPTDQGKVTTEPTAGP